LIDLLPSINVLCRRFIRNVGVSFSVARVNE
jgi:hypothetical protein